ncbi:S-adenosylmethionine:tRNA ribosyltransferase-isomerase [Taibaiella koreensis]|uniref:S-adenosylmethionine:tRNA ribosyltransferase-isomerase n=1 Tax=Taibaiella koreensis TaxID=1268548 RepID=UPI000E59AFE2|nr:S-adenosylmethionine:tRNA ribosyltransferase-isomerase [Taibaiella koreensis]
MHPSRLQIKDFTYELPEDRIARYPLPQRDQSRLLVFRDGQLSESRYRDIAQQLPAGTLLIFNQTKVIYARLLFQKPTGGRIEVFCLEPDERYAEVQQAMLQKGSVYWKCLVGGAAKWKEGQVLSLEVNEQLAMKAAVAEKREGYFILELSWEPAMTFAEALQLAGRVPLPPYLNREAEESDEQRYQTIFAKEEGSVAAPTAALHFTEAILAELPGRNIDTGLVTLHVGAGTFKPVKSDTMEGHDMHAEWIEADPLVLQQLIDRLRRGLPVVAVGTTSARTLESLYWIGVQLLQNPDFVPSAGVAVPQWYPYEQETITDPITALEALSDYLHRHKTNKLVTRTRIIIAPGYRFRVIKGLITNFHQPQSTLLLLVSALVGTAWRDIYDYALEQGFRFLSYGDGCLLWHKELN